MFIEKRKLWGNLVEAFEYLKEAFKKEGEGLFIRADSDRTRDNSFKEKAGRFRLDVRKKIITQRMVRHRTGCPESL